MNKKLTNIEKQIKRIATEMNKCATKMQELSAILKTEDKKKILGGYTTFRKCQRLFTLEKEYDDVLLDIYNHLEYVVKNKLV